MQYRAPKPTPRHEAEKNLASGDISLICDTMVNIAFFEPDADWVEGVCVEFLTHHPAYQVRAISATCLGHLARIHRNSRLARLRPLLKEMLQDPQVWPYASDALDDFDMFLDPEPGSKG